MGINDTELWMFTDGTTLPAGVDVLEIVSGNCGMLFPFSIQSFTCDSAELFCLHVEQL